MTRSLRTILLALCIPLTIIATPTTPERPACKAYRQSLDLLRKLDVPRGTANVVSGRTNKVRTGDVWKQVWTTEGLESETETVSIVGSGSI